MTVQQSREGRKVAQSMHRKYKYEVIQIGKRKKDMEENGLLKPNTVT